MDYLPRVLSTHATHGDAPYFADVQNTAATQPPSSFPFIDTQIHCNSVAKQFELLYDPGNAIVLQINFPL